ncbi:hypothetical protein [Muribaculum sp.]|uniref:hypothetical protein n=1 Tax=Muribaculum sp. TaxID=1918611 RepID=UPI0023C6ED25|nr:hypothetical protein [Muribaculum sp.]MDE5706071.1 hypothetical protein [Muribaculum sp.]
MSRSEIILYWICEQVRAGKIKPREGLRLSDLVNKENDTVEAEGLRFVLWDHAQPDRQMKKGRKRQPCAAENVIAEEYDPDKSRRAIFFVLSRQEPRPVRIALFAWALVKAGILRNNLDRPTVLRFLQSLNSANNRLWSNSDTFRANMTYWDHLDNTDETTAAVENVSRRFNQLYRLM